MKLLRHILPCLLLLSSCSEEQTMHSPLGRLNISFDYTDTRSKWDDQTDTEGGKVSYIWTDGTDMLTAIRHGGKYVSFYEDVNTSAQYYSDTKFWKVENNESHIQLETVWGVKYGVENGEYTYPVAADDAMYCFHPINEHTTVHSSVAAVSVDMSLPSAFSYASLKNDLSSLAKYSYVYTQTTIKEVTANDVIANAGKFNSACAIVRFNVTNAVTNDIVITGIKMESDNGSKIFPNLLRFADGSVAEQADTTSYYSCLTTDIASVTIPRSGKGIFYNMCFPLDGDFNGVPLRFTIDTNYLTYQLRLDTDVITNHKFEAGKIYTFNFGLEEKEIRLNTIDISQCTTYNVDKTESLNIIVSPDAVWDQTGSNMAQMVFVSLGMTTTIGGQEYDVLWATCNLGAREALETGNHYAWGEVAKKDASQYSPDGYTSAASSDISNTEYDAVKAHLGAGYWLWRMPTREMWQDIITNCTWTWQTVKKVTDGTESEENLDFDASVWAVKKTDAAGKTVGIIYFPITGYSGLDDKGTYTKVNKARCHYWTSTPSEGETEAGATKTSWAFETTYSFNANHGEMSTPVLKECERYNGYCIRPVLLKKKNN